MYMNGTHQDTHQDTSRYIKIHQDTYRIGNYTKSYRKQHHTAGGSRDTHGTHGTHGRTRAHGSHGRTSQPSTQTQADTNPHENRTDHTDEPHNHPPKPNDTNPHENRDRLNSRKNSRKPGVDRSPRPTQKRPPPANPTLPPPAPRAPPRACSWGDGGFPIVLGGDFLYFPM